jgi:hypothetical protein
MKGQVNYFSKLKYYLRVNYIIIYITFLNILKTFTLRF